MNQAKCPVCGGNVKRNGSTKSGAQRWYCSSCKLSFTQKIDTTVKRCKEFLSWLFSKKCQKEMPGEGRTFRRRTRQFWAIWPMPPKVEEPREVLYLDGIYLRKDACILICSDDKNVLGWYLCRYENSRAWKALMSRIAEPKMVVSDGGAGFAKALRIAWPHAKHQRCLFHIFCQIRRYTTLNPQTQAGRDLFQLAHLLLHVKELEQAQQWISLFHSWLAHYEGFLNEKTKDEYGHFHYTHERLVKAKNSLIMLSNNHTLFTFLDPELRLDRELPSTNNRIEGGVNAQLRLMLKEHRGMNLERRMKAIYWWRYMHSTRPLSIREILDVMPTDQSIEAIYRRMKQKETIEKIFPDWGDAIVWSELHRQAPFPIDWD